MKEVDVNEQITKEKLIDIIVNSKTIDTIFLELAPFEMAEMKELEKYKQALQSIEDWGAIGELDYNGIIRNLDVEHDGALIDEILSLFFEKSSVIKRIILQREPERSEHYDVHEEVIIHTHDYVKE